MMKIRQIIDGKNMVASEGESLRNNNPVFNKAIYLSEGQISHLQIKPNKQ